ncbi:MAG TPA: sigma-54-dependent Fis family transcriptional regulator [Thiothrix sp.]|nr:sigma-54-dependent Fis family transcriptional regulator [Thiothrix sp.]
MNTHTTTHIIYGQSPAIQESLRSAALIAATHVTTFITGETGTGKELFARYIHQKSTRKNKPYITINCAALPENLVESSLFGHKKGAFTDAIENHKGIIAQANEGTLFLDEITELPFQLQAKLLRFLENGECQGVGYHQARYYDVRVIAASNKNIHQEVKAGRFRQDLFYRLNIVPLELPPLRKRIGDVALLMSLFFRDLVKEYKITAPTITKEAQLCLQRYTWAGNVRELRNFCERMLILFSGKTIGIDNLPTEIRQQRHTKRDFVFHLPSQGIQLEMLEVDLYEQAIQSSRGNKSAAARLLGLSRDAFLYRLKKYGLR